MECRDEEGLSTLKKVRAEATGEDPTRRVQAMLRDNRNAVIRPNDVSTMGLVHEQLATGRKLRTLAAVGMFSHVSPAVDHGSAIELKAWWPHWKWHIEKLLSKSDKGRQWY
jgi:hypothetical protein